MWLGFNTMDNFALDEELERRQRPPRRRDLLDRLAPKSYMGEELPEDIGRQAFSQALLRAGSGLLRGAGTGDFTGGLADAAEGFTSGMGDTAQRYLAMRRQRELDDLDRQQAEEGIAASASARERADEAHGWAGTDREGGLEAAEDLARQIAEQMPDSPEAARARALARGGPELLDDLRALHEQVVARERFDDDFDRETGAGIRRDRARIDAGVEGDPEAEFNLRQREHESLTAWRRASLANERARIENEGRGLTMQQREAWIARRSDDLYTALVDEQENATPDIEEGVRRTMEGHQVPYSRLRQNAERMARSDFEDLADPMPPSVRTVLDSEGRDAALEERVRMLRGQGREWSWIEQELRRALGAGAGGR